jgi:hypothetical protein
MPSDSAPEAEFLEARELFHEIENILSELAKDANAHGFDVSPYLRRLADAGVTAFEALKASKRVCN